MSSPEVRLILLSFIMDSAEYSRRMSEELAQWSVDQYHGDLEKRRMRHEIPWKNCLWCKYRGDFPLPPGPICVVGCGHGGLEHFAARDIPDRKIIALDLVNPSPEPPAWIDTKNHFPGRIEYFPGWNLKDGLPDRGKYSLIIANSVLHHVYEIEECLDGFKSALTEGGLIYVSEYVGGRGLASDPQRFRVAQQLWNALPREYRLREDGTEQVQLFNPLPEAAGGFESICSHRLEAEVKKRFEVVVEEHFSPLTSYRMLVWGEFGLRKINPAVDTLIAAFEKVVMEEGWLKGENWRALLRNV